MADSVEWGISENGEMNDDWKIDNSDEEKTEGDWIQSILSKEKRNIGSPCVIEMLSDDINSLNIPEILQQTTSDKETFYDIDTFGSDASSNEKNMRVIIAKSINSKSDTHVQTNTNVQTDPHAQTNNEPQTLAVLLGTENKSNKDTSSTTTSTNQLKDINVNDMNISNTSTLQQCKRKNKKRQIARKNLKKNCIDNVKANGSSQRKNDIVPKQKVGLPCYVKYIRAFQQQPIGAVHQRNVDAIQEENNSTPQHEIIDESPSKSMRASPNKITSAFQRMNLRDYIKYIRAFQQDQVSAVQQGNVASTSQHVCNKKLPGIYCIRNMVIVIMKKESGFCFTGKLLIKVLYGAVKIYGSVLDSSTDATKVYSPRGYNHVAVETTEASSEGSIENIWTTLATKGITRDSESKLQIDIDNIQPGTAVLTLQNFENNLTFFLQTYFTHFKLFPIIKNPHYYPWTDPRRAEIILQANLYFEQHDEFKYKRLIFDSDFAKDIAERMLNRWRENKWSCTMITGGKSVGKSTSVRYLINSLLRTTKVILVDVDPGQAECTPASCISYSLIEEPLMGPNFTHLKTPVYQLFLDEVNVASCVLRYLEGIKMLMERLKGCPVLSRLPVVVNTMGFVQGLGWDIAIFVIKLIRPSFILQIKSTTRHANYKQCLSADVINKEECMWTFCDEKFLDWSKPCEHDVCIIPSQADILRQQNKCRRDEGMWNMEPYQKRELVMMSYLSDITRISENDDSFHMKLPMSINEAVPYTAPFSSLCIIPKRLFGVPPSHALNVINGNIVALCGMDLTEESSQESNAISTVRVLTQRSSLCTCYGFGIIRGIDIEQQEIFINTPLPASIMQYVNCLAGCTPVPPALLQLDHNAPYVGGNAGLPTSRESRRRGCLMKMHKKKSNKSPNKSPNETVTMSNCAL